MKTIISNIKQSNLQIPALVSLFSFLILATHTIINNPYSVKVQLVVFTISTIFNIGIFAFYEIERKLSFYSFFLNCVTIFCYLRLSINTSLPIIMVYYFVIFIGFHVFTETFTKRFFLRIMVILLGYYRNSEYIKIILWIIFVFIPSLLKHGDLLFIFYHPLMTYCYLYEHYIVLMCLFLLIFWCFLLFLLNKFNFAAGFLNKCLNYFSRRACLHFVGNTFGRYISNVMSGVKVSIA